MSMDQAASRITQTALAQGADPAVTAQNVTQGAYKSR